MIIAIMGDTFDKVTEQKAHYALTGQTEFTSEFVFLLKLNQKLNRSNFMYVITPNALESAQRDEDWTGSISRVC